MKKLILVAMMTALMVVFVGCNRRAAWNKTNQDDPRLVSARAKAKETFPEFVKAFKNRQAVIYSVTVKYPEGDTSENLELDVLGLTDTEIKGKVASYPKNLGNGTEKLLKGSIITVPIDSMIDWYYEDSNGEGTGGYVADAEAKIQRNG